MRRFVVCLVILLAAVTLFAGCSSKASNAAEAQLKAYQEEIESLKQENAELSKFKDRLAFNLSKMEDTLYALNSEGLLPFAGTQVNAPELIAALPELRSIKLDLQNSELVLSMMPQEWSGDFSTILVVYDVYKPGDTVASMAGVFKKTEGKWQLVKFTRDFKGNESFGIKNI